MKLGLLTLLLATPLFTARAQDPTADFPSARDWNFITRPAGSIIASTLHSDNDELQVPTAAYIVDKFGSTKTASGPVDYLAYSGPVATSSLQNFTTLSAQITQADYKPIFTCIRKACGGYQFLEKLFTPLVDSLSGSHYLNFTINSFGAFTDDVRSASFQRGKEYLVLTTSLAPGTHSGVLLIHVGGTSPETVPVP